MIWNESITVQSLIEEIRGRPIRARAAMISVDGMDRITLRAYKVAVIEDNVESIIASSIKLEISGPNATRLIIVNTENAIIPLIKSMMYNLVKLIFKVPVKKRDYSK